MNKSWALPVFLLIPFLKTITNKTMKTIITTFLSILALAIGISACGSKGQKAGNEEAKEDMQAEILALEGRLKEQVDEMTFDTFAATTLIDRTRTYAELYPQDSMAAPFLFQAASVLRGMGKFQEAIDMWGHIVAQYEDFPKVPEAVFFQGFTYDNDLRDADTAKKYYEYFLERYPKHPIAKDVQILLDVLESGKSPEEMIKEFQMQREAAGE